MVCVFFVLLCLLISPVEPKQQKVAYLTPFSPECQQENVPKSTEYEEKAKLLVQARLMASKNKYCLLLCKLFYRVIKQFCLKSDMPLWKDTKLANIKRLHVCMHCLSSQPNNIHVTM